MKSNICLLADKNGSFGHSNNDCYISCSVKVLIRVVLCCVYNVYSKYFFLLHYYFEMWEGGSANVDRGVYFLGSADKVIRNRTRALRKS